MLCAVAISVVAGAAVAAAAAAAVAAIAAAAAYVLLSAIGLYNVMQQRSRRRLIFDVNTTKFRQILPI